MEDKMLWDKVCIESTAYDLPERRVTSVEIEEMFRGTLERFGLEPGRLESISGVKARRWYEPNERPSAIASRAGSRALERAGIRADQLDLLINASVTRDYTEPATAAIVGGNLDVAHRCLTYDITHACMGFITAMTSAANAIELGQVEYALITAGENPAMDRSWLPGDDPTTHRPWMATTIKRLAGDNMTPEEFRTQFASLTLGCAGVAVVMCREDLAKNGHQFRGAVARSATEHNTLCLASETGEMRTDTAGLLQHGAAILIDTFPKAAKEFGWVEGDHSIDRYICHQASMAHFQRVFTGLDLDMGKIKITLHELGNCAAAALPITLAIADDDGTLKSGDEICFFAAGSGLGAMLASARW